MRVLVLGIALLLACVACGGEDDGAADQPGAVGRDPHTDEAERADASRRAAEMTASPEYQAARERVQRCLEQLGYVGEPLSGQEIVLPDGRSFRIPGPENPAAPLAGPYRRYQIDAERCQEEAGFFEVVERFGFSGRPEIDPAKLAEMNAAMIAEMQCMEGKGWDIPASEMLQGMVVFDINHATPEEEAAWRSDYATCEAGQ
jgi:hypothetical protein